MGLPMRSLDNRWASSFSVTACEPDRVIHLCSSSSMNPPMTLI